MDTDSFISILSELRFPNTFNPYSDTCLSNDLPDAAEIRRNNLHLILKAATSIGVDSIWVARDLGYRGGRRTGLALTDETHLSRHASIFGCTGLHRATIGPPVAERTASVIWSMLIAVGRPVFLWNVFPLHPHEKDDPLSNRCHTRYERQACRGLMLSLLDALKPKQVVAIGKDAQNALSDLQIASVGVRHPSYGGQSEFIAGISQLYELPIATDDQIPLSL